jgi:hypothetical protein
VREKGRDCRYAAPYSRQEVSAMFHNDDRIESQLLRHAS